MKKIFLGIAAASVTIGILSGCQDEAASDWQPNPIGIAPPEQTEQVDPDALAEEVYIATLDAEGIYYSSEENAIKAGRSACMMMDAGETWLATSSTFVTAGYSHYQSGYIMGTATASFCPEHSVG